MFAQLDEVLWEVFHDDNAQRRGTKGLGQCVEGDGTFCELEWCYIVLRPFVPFSSSFKLTVTAWATDTLGTVMVVEVEDVFFPRFTLNRTAPISRRLPTVNGAWNYINKVD